jgi:hypothetical protein
MGSKHGSEMRQELSRANKSEAKCHGSDGPDCLMLDWSATSTLLTKTGPKDNKNDKGVFSLSAISVWLFPRRRFEVSPVASSKWGSRERLTQRAFTKLPLTISMPNAGYGPITSTY